MEEIINQLLDRVANLELALHEIKKKEEKEQEKVSPTPFEKKKKIKKRKNEQRQQQRACEIPTEIEIDEYLKELGITSFTAKHFYNYYNAIGWSFDKKRIVDWKSCVGIWAERDKREMQKNAKHTQPTATPQFHETEELLRRREAEQASAVSYQEYLRQKQAGMIGKGGRS